MKRLATILLLIALAVPQVAQSVSAQTGQDQKDVLARAREIFRLADNGDFNAMYDLIHPDARAIIPRVAAVNTFKAIYGAENVGRGVPTGVEFQSWTWGVNGNSIVWGVDGNSIVWGVDGNSIVWGVDGNSIVWGVDGNSIVWGVDGNSIVWGVDANSIVWGVDGNSIVWGGE